MHDLDTPPGQGKPGTDIPDDHSRAPDPDADPLVADEDEAPRGVPASDPEAGA